MAIDALTRQRSAPGAVPSIDPKPPWYAPMTLRELALAGGGLALVGFLIFLPHLLHGGLYTDDWSDAAGSLYPPHGSGILGAFSFMNDVLSSCRPVLIVYIPLKYLLFGTNPTYLIALSIALAVLAAGLAYAILRALNLPWYHSWLIAALTLAYPWFDSTRFWESANPQTLAIVLAFSGLWMALIGLSRNSWRLHAGAAFLYLLSVLTYETTLPFIAAAGLIYTFRNGWRAARLRWGIDLAVIVCGGLWDRLHTPRTVSSLSGDLDHLRQIVTNGGELLARTLFPLNAQPHTSTMLYALAAIFAIGLGTYLLRPAVRDTGSAWGLRHWLLMGGAGLLLAALGWASFIPADPYYTPSIFGVTNRVNGLAGFGLILLVYAALGIVGFALGRLVNRSSWLAAATTLVLALMLGTSYVHVLERHARLWRTAYEMELTAISMVQKVFPHPHHGTTIFVSDYPANVALGVPVFGATWDLNGIVQLKYGDNTLRAYPVTEEQQLYCRAKGVVVRASGEDTKVAPYGTARFLNLSTGKRVTPRSQRHCLSVKPEYPPGPLYLSTAY
jgi:hypothetical protein